MVDRGGGVVVPVEVIPQVQEEDCCRYRFGVMARVGAAVLNVFLSTKFFENSGHGFYRKFVAALSVKASSFTNFPRAESLEQDGAQQS